MQRNTFQEWVHEHRIGVVVGFFVGVALPFFGPGFLNYPYLFIDWLIPNVQMGESIYVPVYKWALSLGLNGVLYAFIGGGVHYLLKKF